MTIAQALKDRLLFILTNLPPRRTYSRWMKRLSQIRNPTWTRMALWFWQRFDVLELDDSPPCRYHSIHDCFIRPLRPGARIVDPDAQVWTSPCDGIVGAFGRIHEGKLYQIKGRGYEIEELIGHRADIQRWHNGHFVTIRIKSGMYHRFHAPAQGELLQVQYFKGDAYNVTPPTLRWIDRLFCKNERACLTYRVSSTGEVIALVPVAAVLVAGIRLHALQDTDWMRDRHVTTPHAPIPYAKGQEMGWFEHGSTIVVLTSPLWAPLASLKEGDRLRMGQALFAPVDQTT
jgi:phosphatidylserine decarboxylase